MKTSGTALGHPDGVSEPDGNRGRGFASRLARGTSGGGVLSTLRIWDEALPGSRPASGSGEHQEEALELAFLVALIESCFLVGQALPELAAQRSDPS